jgi:hypothetical protein
MGGGGAGEGEAIVPSVPTFVAVFVGLGIERVTCGDDTIFVSLRPVVLFKLLRDVDQTQAQARSRAHGAKQQAATRLTRCFPAMPKRTSTAHPKAVG